MSGLGEMGNLLKQAQEMQRKVDRVRHELRTRTVIGSAGGGMVHVHLTADRHEVKEVEISPEALRTSDHEMLEDLVRGAIQDALRRALEMEKKEIGQVTGGMELPGMF
jgi:nucleoid-associated protein EbfC